METGWQVSTNGASIRDYRWRRSVNDREGWSWHGQAPGRGSGGWSGTAQAPRRRPEPLLSQTGCCGCSPALPGTRRTTPAMTTPCTSAASRPPAAASSRRPTAPCSCGSSRAPEPGWAWTSAASPAGTAPGQAPAATRPKPPPPRLQGPTAAAGPPAAPPGLGMRFTAPFAVGCRWMFCFR